MNLADITPVGQALFWTKVAVAVVLALILAGCGIYVWVLRSDLADTTSKLQASEVALKQKSDLLDDLASQRKQLEADLVAAKARATQARKSAEVSAQTIMSQPIPADCDGAAAWAIEQAETLK